MGCGCGSGEGCCGDAIPPKAECTNPASAGLCSRQQPTCTIGRIPICDGGSK